MEYTCPKCKTIVSIPDGLLKQSKSKIHCIKCGIVITPAEIPPFDTEKMARLIRQWLNSDLN